MEILSSKEIEKSLRYYSKKLAKCYYDFTGLKWQHYQLEDDINKLIFKYLYETDSDKG